MGDQWEYRVVLLFDANGEKQHEQKLNELGDQGFDIVAVDRPQPEATSRNGLLVILKRPKPQGPPQMH